MIETKGLRAHDVGRMVVFDNYQPGTIVRWDARSVWVDYGFGVFPTPARDLRFASALERLYWRNLRLVVPVLAILAVVVGLLGAALSLPALKVASGTLVGLLICRALSGPFESERCVS